MKIDGYILSKAQAYQNIQPAAIKPNSKFINYQNLGMRNHFEKLRIKPIINQLSLLDKTCETMNLELTETSTKHLRVLRGQKSFVVDMSGCAHFRATPPKMGAVPKTYRTSQERSACILASQKQERCKDHLTRNNINGKQNAYRCRTPRGNSGCGFTGRPC
jgi:hypothetical protein